MTWRNIGLVRRGFDPFAASPRFDALRGAQSLPGGGHKSASQRVNGLTRTHDVQAPGRPAGVRRPVTTMTGRTRPHDIDSECDSRHGHRLRRAAQDRRRPERGLHRGAQGPAVDKISGAVDEDETEAAEGFELPGADLSNEELSVRVLPRQADEFTCSRCFLVHHRSQLAERVRAASPSARSARPELPIIRLDMHQPIPTRHHRCTVGVRRVRRCGACRPRWPRPAGGVAAGHQPVGHRVRRVHELTLTPPAIQPRRHR